MAPETNDIALRIGEVLHEARERSGWSQEDLSLRAGIHRTAVGNLERGTRVPRVDSLIRIAGALGIPPADLLGGLVWEPVEFTEGGFRVQPADPEAGR